MESELHYSVRSVQQLLEEEAPEWAGPAEPLQSSQWGFSCSGRWADEILTEEDVHPETAWFEPQRSSSVGHVADRHAVDESKRRSRRRSKRRRLLAEASAQGESTISTIRVLQLEQLLMLDERVPSHGLSPVGKQRRAASQPPISSKAKAPKAQAGHREPREPREPQAKAKSKAKAAQAAQAAPASADSLVSKTPKRRPYQSFYQMPETAETAETQTRQAQAQAGQRHQTHSDAKGKADGWRSGEPIERPRRVRSTEMANPEAVPQGQHADQAPEHVGQEREAQQAQSHASEQSNSVPQRGTFHSQPTRHSEDSRRRHRSRPKTPKTPSGTSGTSGMSGKLPQRSGRAWRAGRRPSDSTDPVGPGPADSEKKHNTVRRGVKLTESE